MKNILVGQSGGPTAVINGSLFGVISEALNLKKDEDVRIYGMINGVEGFLKGNYVDLEHSMDQDTLAALKTTPGAYLGSCRYKLPVDLTDPVYPALFAQLEQLGIGYLFYIGGNDSMDTVSKLCRYAADIQSDLVVLGIPKTIDNDLILTDHTPGFGSAAKFVATTVREIGIDASIYDTCSVTIVEIMGRHAGWLTGASVMARKFAHDNPIKIYLPEVNFDQEQFIEDLAAALDLRTNVVVCISEGIHDQDGTFICEYQTDIGTDNFGHKMLAGAGKYLENLIRERLEIKVRSVELNVSQRCASMSQSLTDLNEAIEAGCYAVRMALMGATGQMVSFRRCSKRPYEIEYGLVDVNLVCNQEKQVPLEWITKNGTEVSKEFIKYTADLIQGVSRPAEKNGIPVFAYRQ